MDKGHPTYNADTPINSADNDLLGRAGFARNLAQCIQDVETKEGGFVIALCGPWGSGKSSIINLIKSNLESVCMSEFSCLYTQSEMALLHKYIQTINGFVPKAIDKESLYAFFAFLGKVIQQPANVALASGGVPPVAEPVINYLMPDAPSVETLISDLRKKFFEEKGKKFVLFIDDVDRLPPEQIINIFRMVKTLGDLPNLVTVLTYDDEIVRKLMVKEYEAEGEVFMDKMVQLTIPVPPLSSNDIKKLIDFHFGIFFDEHIVLHGEDRSFFVREIIGDLIKAPRDVVRLSNNLQLFGKSIGSNLNKYDLLVLETLKLKRPDFYTFIKEEKENLASLPGLLERRENFLARFEKMRSGLSDDDKQMFFRVISFLFEDNVGRLYEDAQNNSGQWSHQDNTEQLKLDRRLASSDYSDSFFRLSLSENVLSVSDAEELRFATRSKSDLKKFLSKKLDSKVRSNHFDLLMDELKHLARRDGVKIETLRRNVILVIFELADRIMLYYQNNTSMTGEETFYNIFWLVNTYTKGTLTLSEKDNLFTEAMGIAFKSSVVWSWIFAERAFWQYDEKGLKQNIFESDAYCSKAQSEILKNESVSLFENHLEEKLSTFSFVGHSFFNIWSTGGKNDLEIKKWIKPRLDDDKFVVNLCKALSFGASSYSTSSGAEFYIVANDPSDYLNLSEFRKRSKELAQDTSIDATDRQAIKDYWDAFDNPRKNPI